MFTASEARERLVNHRKEKIAANIKFAVEQGESLTHFQIHPTQEEIDWVKSYGYRADGDHSGNLWIYWFAKEETDVHR